MRRAGHGHDHDTTAVSASAAPDDYPEYARQHCFGMPAPEGCAIVATRSSRHNLRGWVLRHLADDPDSSWAVYAPDCCVRYTWLHNPETDPQANLPAAHTIGDERADIAMRGWEPPTERVQRYLADHCMALVTDDLLVRILRAK